ncbi:Rieske 2Fe-2S domain-containing protein [Streptomyces sp. NPDC008092]|uniref:Rieske 2Fe-2S domain-containing protein n=1 Tax=Streptomyces sp. NPDC008092 TaxID=3364808 RepID=UPI0036E25EB3
MAEDFSRARTIVDDALVEDPDSGVHRIRRSVFTDEEFFEPEMRHIFERNWVHLAHESQIPATGDCFTTYIGRRPVVVSRDRQGELRCLINAGRLLKVSELATRFREDV